MFWRLESHLKSLTRRKSGRLSFSPWIRNFEDSGNDPIVVSVVMTLIWWNLVDDGSAIEVLMYEAFKGMALDKSLIRPTWPIYNFTNQSIWIKGLIKLLVTLSLGDNLVTILAEFLVVDLPSTYNAIIFRPLMNKTSMVTTVYCLTVKFLTAIRIGYIKADQTIARQCHIQSLYLSKQVIRNPIRRF